MRGPNLRGWGGVEKERGGLNYESGEREAKFDFFFFFFFFYKIIFNVRYRYLTPSSIFDSIPNGPSSVILAVPSLASASIQFSHISDIDLSDIRYQERYQRANFGFEKTKNGDHCLSAKRVHPGRSTLGG